VAEWQMILVDNRSEPPLGPQVDLSWHPHARIVREEQLGLTAARLRGLAESIGELIVLVDDDNLLAADFLVQALTIAGQHPFLGTWSGQIDLRLEAAAPAPPARLRHLLCERKLDEPVWSNDPAHVHATPWGAGMCIRRPVAKAYAEAAKSNPRRLRLDLHGEKLSYGGDTDIAYTGCAIGLGMGVFPELRLAHLIPAHRCKVEYLLDVVRARAYSEILHSWVMTGAIPAERSDLRGRAGAWLRWLAADSLGRRMIRADRTGRAAARNELGGEQ
jgi:glycosyltransferase involved in cell wall biosynthesis